MRAAIGVVVAAWAVGGAVGAIVNLVVWAARPGGPLCTGRFC